MIHTDQYSVGHRGYSNSGPSIQPSTLHLGQIHQIPLLRFFRSNYTSRSILQLGPTFMR